MALRLVIVSVPVRIVIASQCLLSGWPVAVVHRRLNHCVTRTPGAVRLVVLTETCADHFVSAFLSFGVNSRVDRQTALRNSSRVFIFKLLANVLDRIIEWRRLRLRLVIRRVSELYRFGFGRVDFSLAREAVLGHKVQHQIAPLFCLPRFGRWGILTSTFWNTREQRGLAEC